MTRPNGLLLSPGPPLAEYTYGVTLRNAHDLTEYDLLFVEPTFNGLMGHEPGWSEHPGNTPVDAELFKRRNGEFRRFLRRGGVAICFVGPISDISYGGHHYALDFLLGDRSPGDMGITPRSGTTLEVLDEEHALAGYLRADLTWIATLERGVLATDPFGAPLAVTREGQIVAYEEAVDGGLVLWVPPPTRMEQWGLLIDAGQRLWQERQELAPDLAEDARLAEELARLEKEHRERRAAILNELRERREQRRRFAEEDPVVARARSLRRAASSYGPARAIKTMADMLEHIEKQYGGERAAREAVGYSENTAEWITKPANDPRYFSRHAGAEAPVPVPDDEFRRATEASDEILDRFIGRRFREWQEHQSPAR